MIKKVHFFLLRVITAICLLPSAFFLHEDSKPLAFKGKNKVFNFLLNNPFLVYEVARNRNRLMRIFVTYTYRFGVAIYQTQSFTKAIGRTFEFFRRRYKFYLRKENQASSKPLEINSNEKKYYDYINFITSRSFQDSSDEFVPLMAKSEAKFLDTDIRAIAFYLPQFHTFPLNDEWYGKGFTEWTNVTKAIPQYTGHYQPQLPIDTGYYDLNDISVMKRQVELASLYGIHGFCFHYYWFSGTRLMEMPIFKWLEHQEINFPFCLNWANENWGKLWDGGDREVRHKQELLDGDPEKFFQDILPFFQDYRYIKVNGKPLLIIYRPQLFPRERCLELVEILRKEALANGFPGLYLVTVNSHGFQDNPGLWGLDAMLEFPPHGSLEHGLKSKTLNGFVNPYFTGNVWDAGEYVKAKKYLYDVEFKLFKGVCPSWDNTPRKAYSNGAVLDNLTPDIYQEWLEGCIDYSRKHHSPEERFIFINAWNEWAEGAHLEPDTRFGYAYLQATRNALSKEIRE